MKVYDLLSGIRDGKLPLDITDAQSFGVQISSDGKRMWVCIDGISILRVKCSTIPVISVIDDRKKK